MSTGISITARRWHYLLLNSSLNFCILRVFYQHKHYIMEQQNQGKISIQHEERRGEEPVYGEVLGEREYLYFSEAKEALESLSWEDASEIANIQLNDDPAILIKLWRRDAGSDWNCTDERVLLLFNDK